MLEYLEDRYCQEYPYLNKDAGFVDSSNMYLILKYYTKQIMKWAGWLNMQKKMVDEGKKRIKILMDIGLWDEVMEFWEKGTACFSKPKEMLGQVTGVTFTLNEDEELKTIKEKL